MTDQVIVPKLPMKIQQEVNNVKPTDIMFIEKSKDKFRTQYFRKKNSIVDTWLASKYNSIVFL